MAAGLCACGGDRGSRDLSSGGAASIELSFENTATGVAFTGDAVCAQCHEDEWQSYQGHAMARSYYEMSPNDVVEDFGAAPVYDEPSGYWYRAYREGDAFFQEEYRQGASGEKTHSLVRPMQFVMGSGNAARTYYSLNGGRYHQLPLTWFTQRARWAMSPGYEKVNKRFDRLIPERCMACHNSYPDAVPMTDGKYESVPFGIGCERCHGPGGLHVEARRRDAEVSGVDPTIVNPAHLSSDRQLDVCQQCHLNTTVSLLRDGRSAFDFRPGQRLEDYLSLFVAAHPDGDEIGVISHADRLKGSACFIESAKSGSSMTCTTCHDPHSTFRKAGPAYFDDKCTACHESSSFESVFAEGPNRSVHVTGGNCASCHMPFVASGEAPHASFTDHRIRVVRSGSEETVLPTTEELQPYFERDKSGPEAARYAGMAAIVAGRQRSDPTLFAEGVQRLARYLAEYPEDGEAQYLSGFALLATGRIEEAIPHLEAAVTDDPDVPERLNSLAEAYVATGRDPQATERLYRRALTVQPALSNIRVNLGRFLQARGRNDEALQEYRTAADETPWMPEAHYNVGTALLAAGDREGARTALDQAIRLDPDYGKALGNRALLALADGDRSTGRDLLERAVRATPDDPVVLGNLGAFYVETDQLDRAIPLLERAVRANPDHADALVNLSVALIREDRSSEARPYAERAARLKPDDPLVRQIIAAL